MSDDEVTSAAARHDHLGASPSSVTSAGGAVQCISIVPTMEDDNDGQFIADAILFLSLDPPEVGPSAPPATAAFESRGPSLALLERLAATAKSWRSRRRVILQSGECGLVLREDNGDGRIWLQIRRIGGTSRDTRMIEREYRCVSESEIAGCKPPACPGERVAGSSAWICARLSNPGRCGALATNHPRTYAR